MCEMASFLYKYSESLGLEIAVYDLMSHSDTQKYFPEKTEKNGWYEGHYKKNEDVVCRIPGGESTAAKEKLLERYPCFLSFLNSPKVI